MKPKSQSKSKKSPFVVWSLFFATRTRRLTTIAIATIAICTIALATLSLAQTEKRIQRATSEAKPASKIERPEKKTSSRDSDRFRKKSGKFREQESSLNDQKARRERNRDGKPREWKLRRARPFTGDLRHLPQTRPIKSERPEREGPEPNPSRFVPPGKTSAPEENESTGTPATPSAPEAPAPPPTASFEGLDFNTWGNGHPPDTVGDVGPTYYIQAINTSLGIYDKANGNLVTAFTFNTLMSQGHFGNLCDTNNFGDPVILYDTFEDRWVVTDFAFQLSAGAVVNPPGAFQCFAVSRTSDPVAGGWNFYSLQMTDFLGDYPKLGIWPDGIYMSANMFGFAAGGTFQNARVFALNKAQMYAGAPTVQSLSFDAPAGDFTILPSNARLQSGTPPPGTPNYFLSTWQFLNAVTVYKFHVDWNHVALSTFTGPDVPIAATSWPNASVANAPSQGGNNLDVLQIRAMMQNQYTNIGGVESLWAIHTVRRGNTTGFAAPRYYQVPVTGGTVGPNITQAATFDPDAANVIHRFAPSLGVDRAGNMAFGYSTSSSTTKPAIKYAGRLATDPINTFSQTEQVLIQGAGTQTGNCGGSPCTRWGDYSAMSVDPDGCTFWFTSMYYAADGLNHHTRIGSFGLPQCTAAVAGTLQGTVTSSSGGGPISGATVSLGSRTTTTDASGFYSFSSLPPGTYPNVTATFGGYSSASVNSIVVNDAAITTQNFVLSPGDNPSCLTDTTQLDFQRGVATNLDLVTSPGDVRLPDAPRIDQQNLNVTTSGFGFNATNWAGQTFTAGVTGQLTRVDLDLFCSACTGTTPNITVSIRATAGSPAVPTGADLATATIPGFSSGSGGYFSANFAAPLTVNAGTRYAVIMRPVANPSAGIYAYVVSSANPYPNGQRVTSANSGGTWTADITSGGRDLGFKAFVKTGFPPSGNLTSGIFDANPYAGGSIVWTTLSWNATVPAGTNLQFQVAGSNSINGPFSFVGPDGTNATFFTNGASLSQFNGLRYLKYQAFFSTTDATLTPTLNDVSLCNSNTVPTSLSVSSATGTYGGTVNLSATLTDGTSPLSGKTVNFTLNGNSVGNGVTDASGIATLNNASLAGINAGSYPTGVGASFAGNTTYVSSSATNSLTVNKADAVVVVTGYSVQYDGNPHTATGTATGVNGESLAGLDLSGTTHTNAGNYAGDAWSFTDVTGNYNNTSGTVDDAISKAPSTTTVSCPASILYSGSALTPCTATATGAGNLSASVNVTYTNNVDPGVATANATYAGDPDHNGSSGSANFTITALPVNFVIGNLNAIVGQKVTFWGAQWGKLNSLSGGAPPPGFKGYATGASTNPASCGGRWTSAAGDTTPPPSVPRFITVIVTSSATKTGSTINGNTTKLVIIKVDPGYSPDLGTPGTGTVYSVVCP
jgi:Carboxypeptidase regulatory-like domain